MCGITGILDLDHHLPVEHLLNDIDRMQIVLSHRGPDDSGIWMDKSRGIAIAHRRLAIIDLSAAGHQPMLSADGRYVITYNGEIYNFLELRKEIEIETGPIAWNGHTDTEVLLKAIDVWGFTEAVRRCNGMFAIAMWDRENQSLVLCRDRAGEKPLYYGYQNGVFVFASELKALQKFSLWHGQIDRQSVGEMMRFGYVPSPQSIFLDIKKVMPGVVLSLSRDDLLHGQWGTEKRYWSLPNNASEVRSMATMMSHEAETRMESLLLDSVKIRTYADVPVGAFLSGGIDSSLCVALMQVVDRRPVKTFTIGFEEQTYDESKYAARIAKHLGTDHMEMRVTSQDALNVVPLLPDIYDEPFADSSQIPTYLLSMLTRRHVTVSMSGDAGDEIFGGYSRYFLAKRVWQMLSRTPISTRHIISSWLRCIPTITWRGVEAVLRLSRRDSYDRGKIAQRALRISSLLSSYSKEDLYNRLVATWEHPAEIVMGLQKSVRGTEQFRVTESDFLREMMYQDFIGYLPDDILVKVDRASMRVSLESRIPFLDPRVIDFAWSLETSQHASSTRGKLILRKILAKYVPEELTNRPKMGFAIPVGKWLRNDLRDWAESLLSPSQIGADGFLNVETVQRIWKEHLLGKRNWQHQLWNILMFQAWKAIWHPVA